MSRGHSVWYKYPRCSKCNKIMFFPFCHWCGSNRKKNSILHITDKYGEVTLIDEENVLVGKSAQCGFKISDNTLVALIHAKLSYHNDNWYVTDLNSTNGTFWNGIRLSPKKEQQLSDNDKICFANSEYIVLETVNRARLKKHIYEVRKRVREKELEIKQCGSQKDKKILKIINDVIFDDLCYIKIDIELALEILYFLGYSKEEARTLYMELVKSSASLLDGGGYTLTEPK